MLAFISSSLPWEVTSGPFCQRLFFTTKQFGGKVGPDDVVMSRFQICQRRRFHFVLEYCQEFGWTPLRFVRSFVLAGLLACNIQFVIWTTLLLMSLPIYHQLIYHCMNSIDDQKTLRPLLCKARCTLWPCTSVFEEIWPSFFSDLFSPLSRFGLKEFGS